MHEPYYKTYFPVVVVATIIASVLLFLLPWKTIAENKYAPKKIPSNAFSFTQETNQKLPETITQPPSFQTVVLMWDIMLSRSIGAWNKKEWYERAFGILSGVNHANVVGSWITWNIYYNPIESIANCKSGWCLLFGNLESPFSPNDLDKHERTMRFRANTGNVEFLTTLRGKNNLVLSVANNHLNNAWWLWIQTTASLLDAHNILHVGWWDTEETASKILVYTWNGISRCIAWYSYDGNGGRYWWKPLYRNKVDLTGMVADLSKMKTELKCDVKAMMLHWGSEYHINPNETQISQAHTLIDNWLDLLIWSHAHIPWKIEVYSGKYIFYSLWNAIFDQDRGMQMGSGKGMDSIYDEILWKNAVPTYIAVFPELLVEKMYSWNNSTQTTITLKGIHGARILKGVYTWLDDKTLWNVVEKVMQPAK